MAYTAPNDLFTSEEAILSLASSIADEDRTNLGNGTINGALDVLADALAERNVEVPPMNAGAILALADYVSGGGGGSSDFTTAHVTVAGISQESIHVCRLAEAQEGQPAATAPFPPLDDLDLDYEFDALLYKGGALLSTDSNVTSTSGSITEIDEGFYLITGDCSIDGGK